MTARSRSLLFSLAYWLMATAMLTQTSLSQADKLPVPVLASATAEWSELTAEQQQLLTPLAQQWSSMDEAARAKWLRVANRYPSLNATTQQRIETRMQQWAGMSSDERNQARLRYQQARQLSPEERKQRWQAYTALPDSERKDLARVGIRKQNPVLIDDRQAGPPEMAQIKQSNPSRLPSTNSPALVAPATIRSGTGATTSFVNQTMTTPSHQQAGLPKINTDESFVDQHTLLPRRGPQGAAMTPVGQ